jgi:hypothetical protein
MQIIIFLILIIILILFFYSNNIYFKYNIITEFHNIYNSNNNIKLV